MPFGKMRHKLRELARLLLSSSLVRQSFTTTIWNFLGKAVGFLIPLAIAAWYGVTAGTDAFFFSYGVVTSLCAIFGPLGRATIVPFVAELRTGESENVERFLAQVFVSVTLAVAGVLALVLLALVPLLPVITDFTGPTRSLAYQLLLETSPLVVLLTWTAVITGVMNAYKQFALPAVSPAFRAVVALALIFALRPSLGLHAVPLGYVAGEAVRTAVLAASMHRLTPLRFRPGHFTASFSKRVRSFLGVAFYQNIALLAAALNPVVDRTMASWLPPGHVSVLYYADRLYMIPTTLVLTGVMTVVRSHWSEDHYSGRRGALADNMALGFRAGGPAAMAVALGLMLISGPATALVFGHGEFPQEQLPRVASAWRLYLAGLAPHVLKLLYFQALITLKDTRSTMLNALGVNALNVGCNYALMWRWGAAGIALSTSITQVFALLFLRWRFARRTRE